MCVIVQHVELLCDNVYDVVQYVVANVGYCATHVLTLQSRDHCYCHH